MNAIKQYCELHVHLEGCVWPEHICNWWERSTFLFPPPSHNRIGKKPFDIFLEHLRFAYNFLNTADAYAEVAHHYSSRCALQNICYAELQINSALLATWGISLADVLNLIAERTASVNNAPVLRYVIDLPWQFDARIFMGIIDDITELYHLGVRGISMGGNEWLAKPEEVADVFAEARNAGLKVQCHAGEITEPQHALRLIKCLNPDRITHGVLIADWIAEQGVASPPIDVCLSSNISLMVVNNIQEHPLRKWWSAGVPVCLSTDDPAIFDTTLEKEYSLAAAICPEIVHDNERVASYWEKASVDPEALAMALGKSYER